MEGPSLVILHEELMPFIAKKLKKVSGNTKQPQELLENCTLYDVDTWGKVLFLIFQPHLKKEPLIVVKIHFLLFGSYRIDDPKFNRVPRLQLEFENGTVFLYSCSIKFHANAELNSVDRCVDLMSPEWEESHVLKLMNDKRMSYLCDLFLDQQVFAGAGNIVKNEVLFNIRKHPLTRLNQVNKKDWPELAHAVRDYCFHFYEWKKKFELRRHWQVYRNTSCPVCKKKLIKKKLGKRKRGTFYCEKCQASTSKTLKVFDVLPPKIQKHKEERLDH